MIQEGAITKIVLPLTGIALAAAAVGSGYEYYTRSICQALEDDFLNSVADMERVVATYPVDKMLGGAAKEHDLAMKLNADAIVRYRDQIETRCGPRARATALRKAGSITR